MATNKGKFDYSFELATTICDAIACGGSIAKFCRGEGTPTESSVFVWLAKHKEFADLYAAARIVQADAFADQMVDIADRGRDAAKVRNQLNARMWAAERANPQRFGAKAALELSGHVGLNVVVRRFTPEPEPAAE